MKKILLTIFTALFVISFSLPVFADESNDSAYPETYSNYVLIGEFDEERILYQAQNVETDLIYPASTTKVMTALLVVEAIERGDLGLDEVVTVGTEVESINYQTSSNAKLIVGEEISVRDLLGVLLIQSACEAANVLAVRVFGSEREFVYQMNQRANQLGMRDTFYRNAHGLYDEEHVSTVYDMYLLFKEASHHELLMTIMSAEKWTVAKTNKSAARSYKTHCRVIDTENASYTAFAIGGKTGYLKNKASAMVMLGQIPDGDTVHNVILVLASSDSLSYSAAFARLYLDTKTMLNWTASHFGTQNLVSSEESLGTIQVKNSLTEELSYCAEESFSYYLPNSYAPDALERILMTNPILEAPVEAGQTVGTYIIKYNGNIIYKGSLVVQEGAEPLLPTPLMNAWQGALVGLAFIALVSVMAVLVVKRKKK